MQELKELQIQINQLENIVTYLKRQANIVDIQQKRIQHLKKENETLSAGIHELRVKLANTK